MYMIRQLYTRSLIVTRRIWRYMRGRQCTMQITSRNVFDAFFGVPTGVVSEIL